MKGRIRDDVDDFWLVLVAIMLVIEILHWVLRQFGLVLVV